MRTLIVLLILASGFGLAALWQARHIDDLRAAQREAWELSDGERAETESGALPEGWGAVIVGAPSGAEPVELEAAFDPAGSEGTDELGELGELGKLPLQDPDPEQLEAAPLADFEMEVQPGQTLSGIAHTHYGTAPAELVQALASYNGIEDPDALRAGAWVLLPERARLIGTE